MASYPSYNIYSNQFQYYNPYSYASYQTTPYGMTTGRKSCLKSSNINLYVNLDGSFQNHYYAFDGNDHKSHKKTAINIFSGLAKVAENLLGGGSGGNITFDDILGGSTMGSIFTTGSLFTSFL